jgi:hypothetical protein
VRRLVLVAVALFLASCAAAVPTAPSRHQADGQPEAAGNRDYGATPAATAPLAGPGPVSLAATEAPASSLPLGERAASAQADFDCDGRTDQLEFFRRSGVVPQEPNNLARLTLASGDIRELAVARSDDASPLIGIADINGDGCDDAIVTVGHGASTTWTSFLVYDAGELRRVEENGKPVMFLFGGSVRHGNAIECRRTKDAPEIVARAASDYTSDFQWDTFEDVHRWSTKSRLVLWSTSRSVIVVSVGYAAPPDASRYWGLSCGNVKFPG